ncbi:MAG: PAS domain-containing sensor histidine kinase [Bacteroidales bacterium]|nr:PAS domain-containing sensor histidine kinase [Bacteroidales bacterium]
MLLAVAQLPNFYWVKYLESGHNRMKYATGIILGLLGIVIMLVPTNFVQHMRLDVRTVLLCLAALFYGRIPTQIATLSILVFGAFICDGWQQYLLEFTFTVSAVFVPLMLVYYNPGWSQERFPKTVILSTIVTQIIQYLCIMFYPTEHKNELLMECILPVGVLMPISVVTLMRFMQFRRHELDLHEKLRKSEDRFYKLTLCMDDCFWELDSTGCIVNVSDSVTGMLGFCKEEVIGKMPNTIVADTESLSRLIKYGNNEDRNDIFQSTLTLYHKKGHKIYVEARGCRIIDESSDTLLGFVGMIHNVTEQYLHNELARHNEKVMREQNLQFRKLNADLSDYAERMKKVNAELNAAHEAARKTDAERLTFVSKVGQEIITPINDIRNYAAILLDPQKPEQIKQRIVHEIFRSSLFISSMVTDIADADRIAKGVLTLRNTVGNVKELFNELYSCFNSRNLYIGKKQILLSQNVELSPDELMIKTDFRRLRQIMSTIIENAYFFTHAGRIDIGCRRYNESELIFSVADTGMGIPEAACNYVFVPYSRHNQTGVPYEAVDHLTLGLSICKQLVEMMGGKIWFNTEASKGTTFFFTLPFVQATDIIYQNMDVYDWSQYTALLIGDSRYNNILISETLQKTGIRFRNVFIGESSVSKVPDMESFSSFDLVLIPTSLMGNHKALQLLDRFPQSILAEVREDFDTFELLQMIDKQLKKIKA